MIDNEKKLEENYNARLQGLYKEKADMKKEIERKSHFFGEGVELGLSFGSDEEYKKFLAGVFSHTMKEIERELLSERIKYVQRITKNELLLLCPGCLSQKSMVYCKDCMISSCEECFTRNHEGLNDHRQKKISGKTEIQFTNKNVGSSTKKDRKSSLIESQSSHNEEEQISLPMWQKFQNYCFPIYVDSAFYLHFKTFFNELYHLYITDLGVHEEKRNFDEQRFFDKNRSEVISKVIHDKKFNTEEKIYINRIIFHNLIIRGTKTTFDDCLKYAKILQVFTFFNDRLDMLNPKLYAYLRSFQLNQYF